MSDLSPELRALLDAERRRPALSPAAGERLLARVEATLAAGPSPAPRSLLRRAAPIAIAFAVGVAAGAAIFAAISQTPRPQVIVIAERPPSAPEPHPLTVPPVAPAPVPVSAPVRVRVRVRVRVPVPVPVPAKRAADDGRDTDLAAERALLETARTALGRGQSDAALAAVAAHAERFPRGRLAEERESLAVEALAQAGRAAEARERAARFHRRWPGSLLGPAVDAALRASP